MAYIASVGIAWYREADYEKLKSIFDDGNLLPSTYDQWLKMAEGGRKQFLSDGYLVVQVYIDPDTFPAWCRERGLKVDANARTQFGATESSKVWEQANKR